MRLCESKGNVKGRKVRIIWPIMLLEIKVEEAIRVYNSGRSSLIHKKSRFSIFNLASMVGIYSHQLAKMLYVFFFLGLTNNDSIRFF